MDRARVPPMAMLIPKSRDHFLPMTTANPGNNDHFPSLTTANSGKNDHVHPLTTTNPRDKNHVPSFTTANPGSKERVQQMTTTFAVQDNQCGWCLAYIGPRRQFCSADCTAQFKLCQQRRDQKQNLNISVDYYGNVKLSIQGLHLSTGSDIPASSSFPVTGGYKHDRRRKRCRNCAKVLPTANTDNEFCDETCENMDAERTKRDDFVNIFQQKQAAERRKIRKWLLDAQDHYTKQTGGADYIEAVDITSGPAALNPLPVTRTPAFNNEPSKQLKDFPIRSSGPSYSVQSGSPSYSVRRLPHVPERFLLNRDEVVTGGPMTLNPIPLRKGQVKPERRRIMDNDKRQLMIDLKWIPKFFG